MAKSTQLKSILLLLYISFGDPFYPYYPWAKWVLTLNNAPSGTIKDQSPNSINNSDFQLSGQDPTITTGLTCSSFETNGLGFAFGYSYSVSNSMIEFGVSYWMYLKPSTSGLPLGLGTSSNSSPNYRLGFDDTGALNFAKYPFSASASGISLYKWTFVVFYFTKSDSGWMWTIMSPEFTTVVSPNYDTGFPGNYVILGYRTVQRFYEVQFFTRAAVSANSNLVIILYDYAGVSYTATTSTCPCEINNCHPEMGCLSTADCQCSILCNCLAKDGVCTSCRDGSYTLATKCLCKVNHVLLGTTCIATLPDNCVDGTSSTVCTQCEAGYFLYDKDTSTTCLSCDTSCSSCIASPDCFACADSVVKAENSCRVDSIGYQLSFSSPNIVIDFAHPVSKTLTISNLKASTEDNHPISTSNWIIDSASTSSKLQIVTDLTESQLPIDLDFYFEQSS